MRALNRKLLRDLWHHRGQMLSIAAVVTTAVMTVLTLRGTYEALRLARERYYQQARFPAVWAQAERAPESLRRRIEQIAGVSAVETRVSLLATLDVPVLDAPGLGLFVSLPEGRRPAVGDVHLVRGRFAAPNRRSEVVLSENFADAHGFGPGDTLRAVLNGRLRRLDVVGVAISPEHSYAVPPGTLFPDDRRYGIFWMSRDALGPAYGLDGAFNEVVLALGPGADERRVLRALDRLLVPYGGLGAYPRAQQQSHLFLQGELDQNRTLGVAIPAVFLAVAAFLLHIVLARLIATQRTEIAVLKAFGYRTREIGSHYLGFALAPVLAGTLAGTPLGVVLGRAMVVLYTEYFRFPLLRYELRWGLVALGAGVSLAAAVLGALGAVRGAARLPPAEAMQPPAPARFRPGWAERVGLGRPLGPAGRMILRSVERQPVRSLLSAAGVAASAAILVVGLFLFDGVDYLMDLQFRRVQREDLALTFAEARPAAVRHDLARLDGVTRVEPFRTVPVRLHAGHREEAAAVTGLEPGARLRRIVSARGRPHPLPPQGLVLSLQLAERLGVAVGDSVRVLVLEGARRTAQVQVAGVVEDFLGLSVYMELEALQRLTRGAPVLSGAFLAVEPDARAALNARLKRLPAVASVSSPAQMLQSFQAQLADSLFVSVFFLLAFSGIIAVAVIYNGARIALSERGRELASLRVLGFSRGEVAALLLGEQGVVTVLGIPLGWALGYLLAALVVTGLATESYRLPFVVSLRTYLWSAAVVLAAALLSGWIVRRRLDRMDLVAVLKTRE